MIGWCKPSKASLWLEPANWYCRRRAGHLEIGGRNCREKEIRIAFECVWLLRLHVWIPWKITQWRVIYLCNLNLDNYKLTWLSLVFGMLLSCGRVDCTEDSFQMREVSVPFPGPFSLYLPILELHSVRVSDVSEKRPVKFGLCGHWNMTWWVTGSQVKVAHKDAWTCRHSSDLRFELLKNSLRAVVERQGLWCHYRFKIIYDYLLVHNIISLMPFIMK